VWSTGTTFRRFVVCLVSANLSSCLAASCFRTVTVPAEKLALVTCKVLRVHFVHITDYVCIKAHDVLIILSLLQVEYVKRIVAPSSTRRWAGGCVASVSRSCSGSSVNSVGSGAWWGRQVVASFEYRSTACKNCPGHESRLKAGRPSMAVAGYGSEMRHSWMLSASP
jgi:hypothetical protein